MEFKNRCLRLLLCYVKKQYSLYQRKNCDRGREFWSALRLERPFGHCFQPPTHHRNQWQFIPVMSYFMTHTRTDPNYLHFYQQWVRLPLLHLQLYLVCISLTTTEFECYIIFVCFLDLLFCVLPLRIFCSFSTEVFIFDQCNLLYNININSLSFLSHYFFQCIIFFQKWC